MTITKNSTNYEYWVNITDITVPEKLTCSPWTCRKREQIFADTGEFRPVYINGNFELTDEDGYITYLILKDANYTQIPVYFRG